MYDFTVVMALLDFVPVFLFGTAAVLLQRDLYDKMPKYAFACFAAGSIDVFCAGFLKAVWKLLFACGVCDFQALNAMFFPTQSIGFLLAGLGMLLMLTARRSGKTAALAVAPPVFSGTFLFITLMVLGLGAICCCLSHLAVRMKKKSVVFIFVLSLLCSLGMGYLSSRDAASAAVNWISEGVNIVGQGALLAGVRSLHRAGLREFRLSN